MCLFGRWGLVTVVWRSFLEIYEIFKKTNCSELSPPTRVGEGQSRTSWGAQDNAAVAIPPRFWGSRWRGPLGPLTFQSGEGQGAPEGRCSLWEGGTSEARMRRTVCPSFYLVSLWISLFEQMSPRSSCKLFVEELIK